MKPISILVLAAAAFALTACGGGGDSPNTVDPTPLRITGSNQVTVARATLSSGFAVARTSTVSTADRAGAQSAGQGSIGTATGVLDSAVRAALAPYLQQQRRVVQSAGARPAAVIIAPPEACANGGTRTVTFDDRDGNSLTSAGDVATVDFAGCSFDQAVLDGTMVMTVTGVTADTSLAGTVQFQSVKVTAGSVVTTIVGAADVTETVTATGTDTSIVARAPGVAVAVASPSYTDTVTLEPGFTIATAVDDSTGGVTVRVSGGFASSTLLPLAGGLTVATLQPVVVTATSVYPTAGQLQVNDAFGGKLLLTVADGANVDLQLDADGNGTFEGDTVVSWISLLPH